MRKSWIAPSLAVLAGAGGAIIRKIELDSVFEETTSLAVRGAPVSRALIALSVLSVAVIFLFSLFAVKKGAVTDAYRKTFKTESVLSCLISFVFGVTVICCSAVFFLKPENINIPALVNAIFSVFSVLSGVSFILLSVCGFTQKESGATMLFSVIPAMFFCFWLALTYKNYAQNPELLTYCYRSIALAFSALAFYYGAGYAFGRAKPRMTVISHLAAIYFLCVTLADSWLIAERLILLAAIGFLFQNAVRFLRAMKLQK